MRLRVFGVTALLVAFGSRAVLAETPAATPAPTANPVPAQALPSAKRSAEITPGGAVWRSAVIPGWGQRYKGERTKGWVFTGLAAGMAAASVGAYQWSDSSRRSLSDA